MASSHKFLYWRTRTTILQSNGKLFAKNIMAILNSVKVCCFYFHCCCYFCYYRPERKAGTASPSLELQVREE